MSRAPELRETDEAGQSLGIQNGVPVCLYTPPRARHNNDVTDQFYLYSHYNIQTTRAYYTNKENYTYRNIASFPCDKS